MLSKDKDNFYLSIVEALKPTTPNQDLNRTLYIFQNQINAFFFTRYHLNDVPDIFRAIWKLLLSSAGNSSSTTRLASYRATGAFLTRVTPYYPDVIHESFSDVTLMATIDVKSSAIIASSFAFISKYIATPYLKKFINLTPVFHHFSSNDPVFSEHLPTIISNLGHLGNDWLKNLLQFFLEKIDESTTASRYLTKAVTAIVGHNPRFFIHHIIDWMKTNSIENKKKKNDDSENNLEIDKKYISLFTFFISGHQKEIEDSVDLYFFAKAAALLLNDNPNLTDMDSAFLMLSTPSNSFRVIVEDNITDENNNKSIKITVIKTIIKLDENNKEVIVSDNENEKVETIVNTEKILKRPSLYMINLPLESLKPTPDDSNLVLGAKFKSISQYYTGQRIHQNDNEDRTLEVFNIYEPYLKRDYNDTRSSALQGLALCINKFLEEVPSEKLFSPLRSILLADTISWFHSFDILRIIKNIQDYQLFIDKLGIDFFVLVLKQLVGFCFCDHESLSKESTLALTNIASMTNLEVIVKIIIVKTDFFDSSILKRSCSTMSSIIEKLNRIICERNNIEFDDTFTIENTDLYEAAYSKVPSIEFYATQLIEGSPLYFDNVSLLTEILRFFSIYKTKDINKIKTVVNSAIFIIISTVEVISGQTVMIPESLTEFINSVQYSTSIVDPNNSSLLDSPLSAGPSTSEIPKTNLTPISNANLSNESKDLFDFFKIIIQQDIIHKNVDIITESFSGNDYKSYILPMKYALKCSFLYVSPPDGIFLSNISHQLFPFVCSKYYNFAWMKLEEAQQNKILASIPKFLRYINDLHIHVEWCKICLKKIDIATIDDNYLTIVDFLVEIVLNYFQTTIGTDPNLAAVFCEFIHDIHYSNATTVIKKYFDSVLEATGDKKFFVRIAELYPEAINLWPTFFENLAIKQNVKVENQEGNDEKNKITFEKLASNSKTIELNGKTIENIYLLDSSLIQSAFEEIVKHNNTSLLKKIIGIAEDRKINLDLKLESENNENVLEYSKDSMELIICYIASKRIKLSYQTFKNLTEKYSNQKRGTGGSSFCSSEENENENESQDEGEIYLRYALNNLKTIWEPYCAMLIEDDPSKLLEFLLKTKKIKKKELISLACLVHNENIQFDLQLLYKLAVKLILPSESDEKESSTTEQPIGAGIKQISISRYRVLFILLTVVIQQIHFYLRKTNFLDPSSIVTLEFAHDLIHKISPDFEHLPVDSLSYLFLILAQTIPIDNDCVLFIWRLFLLCSSSNANNLNFGQGNVSVITYSTQLSTNIPSRSTPYGHLHQILIGLSGNPRLVGRNYLFGLSDIILPCLQSKLPSKIMTGLRLAEQTCLSVPPNIMSYFIQKAIGIIIKKYRYILYYLPTTSDQVYRTFMSFLLKKNCFDQQKFFFNYLPDFTFVSPHSGGFNISIAFYPAVFALISQSNCDNFAKIYRFACETLFKYPIGFTYALKSLLQYVNKLTDDERESVVVDQFVNWLKIVKDSKNRPSSYSEFKPETESIKTYKAKSDGIQGDAASQPKEKEEKTEKETNKSSTSQFKRPKSKGFSLLSLLGKKKEKQGKEKKKEKEEREAAEKEIAKREAEEKEKEKQEEELHKDEINKDKQEDEDEIENEIEINDKDIDIDIGNISNENNVENATENDTETDSSSEQSQSNIASSATAFVYSNSSSVLISTSSISSVASSPPGSPSKHKKHRKKSSNLSRTYLTSFHQFYFGYTFCPNYKLTKQVGEWIDACMTFMTPSKAFSIIAFNLIRYIKFGIIYPKLLKLFIENRDDEELNEMFDGMVDLPQCECHRIALRLFKTCDRFKEMMELASFDQDCDESKKLVDELMIYLRARI